MVAEVKIIIRLVIRSITKEKYVRVLRDAVITLSSKPVKIANETGSFLMITQAI